MEKMLHPAYLKAFVANCSTVERARFSKSHAVLFIEVGEFYQEGERLLALLRFINTKFKRCTIILGDTLQRHLLQAKERTDAASAYTQALVKGNEWMEKNSFIYQRLGIPFTIVRWEEWLKHPDYQYNRKRLDQLYLSNAGFRIVFDEMVQKISKRWQALSEVQDAARLDTLCTDYLKEKCAVVISWAKCGYDFAIFTRRMNEVMNQLYLIFIKPFYANKMVPVILRFKKYSSHHLISQPEKVEEIDLISIPLEGVLI